MTEILGTSPGNATPGVRGVTGILGAPCDCVRMCLLETDVLCSDAESEEQLALAPAQS